MANNSVILVTGSYDHSLIFWDAYNGKSIQQYAYPDNQIINKIEISQDKKYLGGAASNSVKIYDIPSGLSQPSINYDGYQNNVTSVGFQKDNNWIYTGSEDGSIKIWDLRSQGYQRNYFNKDAINSIVLHPNEAELIVGDQQGNLRIYDLTADKCRSNLKPSPEIGIRSISIAVNAYCVVAADSAGYCHVWTLKNGEDLEPFQKFEAHDDYILKCLISPDLKYLATCSADKTIKLWSLTQEKGYILMDTLYGHSKWVWDCAFSCDSDYLITASSDSTAKIWHTDSKETIRILKGHKKGVNCLALNDAY